MSGVWRRPCCPNTLQARVLPDSIVTVQRPNSSAVAHYASHGSTVQDCLRHEATSGMEVHVNPTAVRLFSFVCAITALACASIAPAYSQIARTEVITFQSTTLTDQEFLSDAKDGKAV